MGLFKREEFVLGTLLNSDSYLFARHCSLKAWKNFYIYDHIQFPHFICRKAIQWRLLMSSPYFPWVKSPCSLESLGSSLKPKIPLR